MKRYRGILFISREELAQLSGGSRGPIWNASIEGGKLQVVWSGGRRGSVELERITEQARLDRSLPPPSLAFVADPDGEAVGLLFESTTPAPGLQYVEPHSVVHEIGWLTREGLRARV